VRCLDEKRRNRQANLAVIPRSRGLSWCDRVCAGDMMGDLLMGHCVLFIFLSPSFLWSPELICIHSRSSRTAKVPIVVRRQWAVGRGGNGHGSFAKTIHTSEKRSPPTHNVYCVISLFDCPSPITGDAQLNRSMLKSAIHNEQCDSRWVQWATHSPHVTQLHNSPIDRIRGIMNNHMESRHRY
jgi:hypothetical protein